MADIIRDAPLVAFAIMVAFPLAMAGIAVFAGIHARRRAALVAATPTTPIAFATDGYREFEGKVEAIDGQTLTAPLTSARVCWYHAKVDQWKRGSGDDSGGWHTVKEATSSAPFFVRDATGVAIVDPDAAEVTPTDRSLWVGATRQPSDRNPRKYKPTETAGGLFQTAGGPNSQYRYLEERIYAGDPLLIHGEFSTGRFGARPDASGASDNDADDVAAETGGESGTGDECDSLEGDDRLLARARQITMASIRRGTGKQPFMFTTTTQAEHLRLTTTGSAAAMGVALVPLGLALLLLWLRFGS
jgi:hypothetical protein